jgi:general secretion pathway protein K
MRTTKQSVISDCASTPSRSWLSRVLVTEPRPSGSGCPANSNDVVFSRPCGTGHRFLGPVRPASAGCSTSSSRGGALLAVLWLSVALSTIALTVASTVRGEIDRAATASDDTRAYFLAQSAIQRAILYIQWGRAYYQPGMPPFQFRFPGGDVTVEVMPESSKLNINNCLPADLFRLLAALGVPADRAQLITEAVVDWRTPAPGGQPTSFDAFYLQHNPSFMSSHASFIEVEDLLLVRGMTPDLFYGTWDRDDSVQPSRLTQHIGLRDCISVYSNGLLDVNSTPLPVFMAAGLSPDAAAAIVEQRRLQSFPNVGAVRAFTQSMGPAAGRITLGGNSMFTIRATARPRSAGGVLTDMRRTVAALIKLSPPDSNALFHVVRWYDRG